MPDRLAAAFHDSDLGLRRGVVDVAPAGGEWAAAFERVAAVLRVTAPASVIAIEHIGSTAVPGLPAKAILDVAIGLRNDADLDVIDNWLTGHGMLYRGAADGIRPDIMYAFEVEPMVRLANIHVIVHDSPEWRHYLGFRDRLRADAAARDAYAALKKRLAAQHPDDRIAYIEGKGSFIVARRGDASDAESALRRETDSAV